MATIKGSPMEDPTPNKNDLEKRVPTQPNVTEPTTVAVAKAAAAKAKPTPSRGKPNVGIGLSGRNPGMKMPLTRSGAGLLGKAAAFVDKIYKTY